MPGHERPTGATFFMPEVTLYSTVSCGFCLRAKQYLRSRGIPFREIDVTGDEEARSRLVERSGGQRIVPQIFVGDAHVGGYVDLVRRDAEGRFRPLLQDPGLPSASNDG
jgi:glutaredoxin 3